MFRLVDEWGDYRSVLKEKFPSLEIKDYSNNKAVIWKEIMNGKSSNGFLSKASNIFSGL